MSTELVVRIWADDTDGVSPGERLLQSIDVVESRSNGAHEWKGLVICDASSRELLRSPGALSRAAIAKIVAEHPSPALHFSTRTTVSCWRFKGLEASREFVPLWVESWGRAYATSGGRDWDVEGDATLALGDVGPYCALVDGTDAPGVQQVNERVEENLEQLLDLVLDTANALQPSSMKGFSALALYHPLNAHFTFFRDVFALDRDLRFIRRLWEAGLPGYRTPPLRESQSELDRMAFHPWRDDNRQRALVARLASAVGHIRPLGNMDMAGRWSDRFDYFEGAAGRLVLEYPHFMNAFVDDFYLELMDCGARDGG